MTTKIDANKELPPNEETVQVYIKGTENPIPAFFSTTMQEWRTLGGYKIEPTHWVKYVPDAPKEKAANA
jgi:hypothetical protein